MWFLAIPFFLLARPTPPLLLAGAVLAALGTAVRSWAAGVIYKEREITVAGPYAHTRSPLYLGSFLIGLGATVAGGRWVLVVLFVVLFAAVYGRLMASESARLDQHFGDAHADYARAVPLFVPRLAPHRSVTGADAAQRFTLARWRRNREYEAVLGVVAAFLLLAAKLLYG